MASTQAIGFERLVRLLDEVFGIRVCWRSGVSDSSPSWSSPFWNCAAASAIAERTTDLRPALSQ
jgi:hypothetical protein